MSHPIRGALLALKLCGDCEEAVRDLVGIGDGVELGRISRNGGSLKGWERAGERGIEIWSGLRRRLR